MNKSTKNIRFRPSVFLWKVGENKIWDAGLNMITCPGCKEAALQYVEAFEQEMMTKLRCLLTGEAGEAGEKVRHVFKEYGDLVRHIIELS